VHARGAQLGDVVEKDGLAVEQEGRDRAGPAEGVQQLVGEVREAQAEHRRGPVPLAVPVGVRDDVHGRHAVKLRRACPRGQAPLIHSTPRSWEPP